MRKAFCLLPHQHTTTPPDIGPLLGLKTPQDKMNQVPPCTGPCLTCLPSNNDPLDRFRQRSTRHSPRHRKSQDQCRMPRGRSRRLCRSTLPHTASHPCRSMPADNSGLLRMCKEVLVPRFQHTTTQWGTENRAWRSKPNLKGKIVPVPTRKPVCRTGPRRRQSQADTGSRWRLTIHADSSC